MDFEQVREVAGELVEHRWHVEAADIVAENVPPVLIDGATVDERKAMISAIVAVAIGRGDYEAVRDIAASHPYDLDSFARNLILSRLELADLLPIVVSD